MTCYCDAHCHLGSRQFDEDREAVLSRMKKTGVEKAIIICCSSHDRKEGIRLRKEDPHFKLALSIHPQDLEDHDLNRLTELKENLIDSHADMIGEIGLDYYSHPHTKEFQKQFFIEQLKMAQELHLPVDIHTRKASEDTLKILKEYPVKGIIHSYSGSIEMARAYMKEGYLISFGASVLFKNAKKPIEVIRQIPAEYLLIETDAPYQSPVLDHRHEPSDIEAIYRKIAEIRNEDLEDLKKITEDNFDRVFH